MAYKRSDLRQNLVSRICLMSGLLVLCFSLGSEDEAYCQEESELADVSYPVSDTISGDPIAVIYTTGWARRKTADKRPNTCIVLALWETGEILWSDDPNSKFEIREIRKFGDRLLIKQHIDNIETV